MTGAPLAVDEELRVGVHHLSFQKNALGLIARSTGRPSSLQASFILIPSRGLGQGFGPRRAVNKPGGEG
jgi:hypothetical protein